MRTHCTTDNFPKDLSLVAVFMQGAISQLRSLQVVPLAHFLFPSAGTQSLKSVANPSFTKPSLQIHIQFCPESGEPAFPLFDLAVLAAPRDALSGTQIDVKAKETWRAIDTRIQKNNALPYRARLTAFTPPPPAAAAATLCGGSHSFLCAGQAAI